MLRKGCTVVVVLLAAIYLAACGSNMAPAPKAGVSPKATGAAAGGDARASWQVEWDKATREAKKEGVVVVYTTLGPEVTDVVRAKFRDEHGIDVEFFVGGTGSELLAKVKAERAARLYLGDVVMSGGSTVLAFKTNGLLGLIEQVLAMPEVMDPKSWVAGKVPFVDEGHQVITYVAETTNTWIVNTEAVGNEEAASFKDLLNPKWKGKMTLIDPSTAGSGSKFINVAAWGVMGEDYVRALAKQGPVITREKRLHVETVARGKYPIGLGAVSEMRVTFQRLGAPIKQIVPPEGGALSSGSGLIGLLSDGPHPHAAKVFVNWALSKEGQTIMSKVRGSASRRADVPTDFVDPDRLMKPGIKYFEADTEEGLRLEGQRQALSREIFGIK